MNKAMPAFSMIEFLIYFLISQLFFFYLMHWSALQTCSVKNQMSSCMRSIALCAAQEALLHDIRKIEGQRVQAENNCYVWKQGSVDVGWHVCEHKLFRSEGTFNYETTTWNRRNKSLIADDIETLELLIHYDEAREMIGVTAVLHERLDEGNSAIKTYTKLRNGIVV